MIERSTYILAVSHPPPMRRWLGALTKRVLDLVISVCCLLVLSPLFLYVAWRIKRESAGPVFYRGPRLGKGGKVFHILKFRTMYETPESYNGPRITAQDDPRITPLGKILRDSKLNELPQLWNVLKGEMSLVGPRPEDPEIAADWPDDVRREILSVRPGITSPASVLYRHEESLLQNGRVMDIYLGEILPSKLRLDQLYVRHHSFWGDMDVLFWTSLVWLPKARTRTPAEDSLLQGPLAKLMRFHVNWMAMDVAITLMAMGLTGLIWRSVVPLHVGWFPAVVLAVGFALLFSMVNAILRVNRIDWAQAAASDAYDLVPGVILATLVAMVFNFFFPAELLGIPLVGHIYPWGMRALLPPGLIILAAALSTLGFIVARYRSRLLTGLATRWVALRGVKSIVAERVLIVGGGDTGQFATWILNNGYYARSFRVVGFADDDLYKRGTRIRGLNVLGTRADIPQLVEKHDIGIIVFAIHNISPSERNSVLDICATTPAKLFLFPDIPAALSKYSRNDTAQHQETMKAGRLLKDRDDVDVTKLPCFLCLTKVTPLKVDGWLAQLEQTAQSGSLHDVLTHIHLLRHQLNEDAELQLAANLTKEERE